MGPDAIAERIAAAATVGSAGVTTGITVVDRLSITTVNEYLQAGAFVVAIISGLAATLYYVRKLPK